VTIPVFAFIAFLCLCLSVNQRRTMWMSRDEQRVNDARLKYWRDRAARHRLDPFVGRLVNL
jgi:hypothetical protein